MIHILMKPPIMSDKRLLQDIQSLALIAQDDRTKLILAKLALAGLEPWVRFVDNVKTTLTTHDLAVAVAVLQRFQRAANFHDAPFHIQILKGAYKRALPASQWPFYHLILPFAIEMGNGLEARMMTHLNTAIISLLATLSLTTLPACASSQVTPQIKPGAVMTSDDGQAFLVWKEGFMRRAVQKGYDTNLVNRLIGPAQLSPVVIKRDQTQPEFTRPVWVYIENAVSADRLNQGRTELARNQVIFDNIESRFQVDRHILTAIWGLESAYGLIQGTHDIISALSTLAAEGRRQNWAESQLFAIMDIVRDGRIRPDQLKGAWAGAMGMMQFIPTTFKDYAVDFNGDGNTDIWQDNGDALASAANYLSRFGWQWGAPVSIEITLPSDFDYGQADGRKKSVQDWDDLGVRAINGLTWSDAARMMDAKVLLPAGHKGPKLLTFKNFDVIKRYNNSTSYALGIHNLAESFKGRRAITTAWPKADKPLSRTDKEEMQKRLTALGYDTKGVDGQIGPNTRRAIRSWQRVNGLPADGYVEQALFARIMGR